MFSLLRTGTLLAVLAAPPGLAAPAPFEARGEAPDLFALRVGRAETVSEGTIPFAVVLVEDGEITAIGQDLPIERGIPVYDLPDAVVTPGFVNCKSRLGLDGRGPNGVRPDVTTALELYPGAGTYGQVLEHGVTTLGLYPAGSGVPGQAVAVRPQGATVEAMVVRDSAYLLMYCGANKQAKKYVMDAFELVDDYMEKVEKEREKFEKKSKKSKSKKKKDDEEEDEDDEKDDKKSSKDDDDEFQPPVPDEKTLPMLRLVTGDLRALIGIRKAADYLHLLDAIDGREFEWDLAIDLRDELDLFYIADQLGEQGVRMVVDPRITLHPGTRRERNLPAELLEAGVKIAFVPTRDSVDGHEGWRGEVAELIRYGFPADAALRAMTFEPAAVLGAEEELGSLEVGKRANLLVWDGDPFAPSTELMAVVLEGEVVHGEL